MKREVSKRNLFEKLGWSDLEEWAGGRVLSRGQGYHRDQRVRELAQTQTGGIIAWVQGGRRYATEVDFEDGELISICTCLIPYNILVFPLSSWRSFSAVKTARALPSRGRP